MVIPTFPPCHPPPTSLNPAKKFLLDLGRAGRSIGCLAPGRNYDQVVTEFALEVRLLKPVDSETWSMATRSYHNGLDESGPARALIRVQPVPRTLADSIVPFYLD